MKSKLILITLLLLLHISLFATPPVEEGKAIFANRCAACHNINKTITGPALAGIEERRSMDWIFKFIHSSQNMIKSGDQDAIAVYEKFNKIPMPDHADLTEENVKSIVEYIKSESVTTNEVAPFARPGKLIKAYTPLSINNYGFFIGFLAAVALLIAGLVFAVQVKCAQRDLLENA
jgi:cytochrome c551/c552